MQETIRTYGLIGLAFMVGFIIMTFVFSPNYKKTVRVSLLLLVLISFTALVLLVSKTWAYIGLTSIVLAFLYSLVFKTVKTKEGEYQIVLEHSKGELRFNNPFMGFLFYGGAGSGKTVSGGKPLLSEFMRNEFAIFCYDAKENDYTRTAYWLKEHLNYPYPIYNIDFMNVSHGYRFNPIHTDLIEDEVEVPEIATLIFKTLAKKSELNEWDDKAVGVLKAVSYYLYKHKPELFTIPHIFNMITCNSTDSLLELLESDPVCRNFAKSLIDSQDSKATKASIISTLSGVISDMSANKRWAYILTGNDFKFDLVDPEEPKAFFITNTFKYRNQISPLISLLFVMAMKRVKFGNKIPIVAFLDEGTTFKIEDLEAYPSELREYLLAMVILTQSPAKIEKLYGKYDRSSLEANLQNHFYFRTKDSIALDILVKMFSKIKEKQKSVTTRSGKSDGSSVTTSDKKELRYEKDFFVNLLTGQAVGSAVDSNVTEFNVRFKKYDGGTVEENPFVRMVSQEEIEANYIEIINSVMLD